MELKTPLRIVDAKDDEYFWIEDSEGKKVVDDGSASGEYNGTMTRETACRIVACVNACAGISTEDLDKQIDLERYKQEFEISHSQLLQMKVDWLIKQRDQTLSTLRLVAGEVAPGVRPTCADSHLPSDVVREVLAAVAGGEQADGWIEWSGGECPVGGGLRVEVCFANCGRQISKASCFDWSLSSVPGRPLNIIAYRVVKGGA